MTAGPEEPQGLGTPSDSHPGFAPPVRDASRNWSPPDPGLIVPAPPSGRRPKPARRRRIQLVTAVLAGSLVLVGILSALPLVPATKQPNPAAATPRSIETVTPTTQPGSAGTATTGAGLGTAVAFRTAAGSGTLTVNSAVWTDAGEMAPEVGSRYLILDVTVTCTSGGLAVDALMFLARSSDGPELPGFGPSLQEPLGGRLLEAGEHLQGQVGYALTPGPLSIQLLDAKLLPIAELRIPGP